ncbi:hypothetical protein [Hydrogenophaga sp.]|uniref:hypothetical protein n=1 Tax=Hydrogenophaga sp. TaxID=1904254 RepID=UPI00261927B3|nr:hypothetical protein [Hydrogenophaga sp.]
MQKPTFNPMDCVDLHDPNLQGSLAQETMATGCFRGETDDPTPREVQDCCSTSRKTAAFITGQSAASLPLTAAPPRLGIQSVETAAFQQLNG